jgi:hypothetical protein
VEALVCGCVEAMVRLINGYPRAMFLQYHSLVNHNLCVVDFVTSHVLHNRCQAGSEILTFPILVELERHTATEV